MSNYTRCSVCLHPRRVEVDAALAAGQSYAQAARLIGVSKATVSRHSASGHVVSAPTDRRRTPAAPLLPPGRRMALDATAVDHAQRLVDELAAVDTRALSPRDRFAHAEVMRKALATLADLKGSAPRQSEEAAMIKTLEAMQAAIDAAHEAALPVVNPADAARYRRVRAAALHLLMPSTSKQDRPDYVSAATALGVTPEEIRSAYAADGPAGLARLA